MTRKNKEQQRTNEKVTVSVPEVKAMLSEQKDSLVPVVQEAVQASTALGTDADLSIGRTRVGN